MAGALLIGFYRVNKEEYLPAAILALGIIGAHFIIAISAEIVIQFRTSLTAWIGVLVIFFPLSQYNRAAIFSFASHHDIHDDIILWGKS